MSKHYTKKEVRFQVEFRPSSQATAHGGQLAVNALFQQFGLWQRMQQASALEVSGPSFQGAKINHEGNLALSWQTLWVGPLLADSILSPTSPTKESPSSLAVGNDVSGCLPQLLSENRSLWDQAASYLYTGARDARAPLFLSDMA